MRARQGPVSGFYPLHVRFFALKNRVTISAAEYLHIVSRIASLASGEEYKDTRAGGEVGKVSPLVRPIVQDALSAQPYGVSLLLPVGI
jgi:hypothetical protein